MTLKKLPVAEIEASSAVQVRVRIDKATVKDYVEALEAFANFPPLDVFAERGSERYLLADGFHRLAAYKSFGMEQVDCHVHDGGLREALHYALSANAAHGLRRTNADKRNAVSMALKDPEWTAWNNVKIARMCAVSESLVRKTREDMVVAGDIDERETVKTERGGQEVDRKASRAHSFKTNERDSSEKSKTKELTDKQKKAAKQVRDSVKPKRKTQDEKNAEDFFAGVAAARTAAVADGCQLAARWSEAVSRRDELAYLRDLLTEMIEAIDALQAA